MMIAQRPKGLTIQATDISGHKLTTVRNVPPGSTVGELIDELVPKMKLLERVDGRTLSYGARVERTGRHLHDAERVSDTLQDDDRICLAPAINAG